MDVLKSGEIDSLLESIGCYIRESKGVESKGLDEAKSGVRCNAMFFAMAELVHGVRLFNNTILLYLADCLMSMKLDCEVDASPSIFAYTNSVYATREEYMGASHISTYESFCRKVHEYCHILFSKRIEFNQGNSVTEVYRSLNASDEWLEPSGDGPVVQSLFLLCMNNLYKSERVDVEILNRVGMDAANIVLFITSLNSNDNDKYRLFKSEGGPLSKTEEISLFFLLNMREVFSAIFDLVLMNTCLSGNNETREGIRYKTKELAIIIKEFLTNTNSINFDALNKCTKYIKGLICNPARTGNLIFDKGVVLTNEDYRDSIRAEILRYMHKVRKFACIKKMAEGTWFYTRTKAKNGNACMYAFCRYKSSQNRIIYGNFAKIMDGHIGDNILEKEIKIYPEVSIFIPHLLNDNFKGIFQPKIVTPDKNAYEICILDTGKASKGNFQIQSFLCLNKVEFEIWADGFSYITNSSSASIPEINRNVESFAEITAKIALDNESSRKYIFSRMISEHMRSDDGVWC